jgi:hypothetical protein
MRARPLPVTVAAVLLVLLSLTNLPWPWQSLFPEAEEPPAFIVAVSLVLAIAGLGAAVGLWKLNLWSFWSTIVVSVVNFLLAVLALDEVTDPALRALIVATAIVAALVIVLVALPSSRRALAATSGAVQ